MKRNRLYLVATEQIENWGEDGPYYGFVFARSRTQAAAAFALKMMTMSWLGIDEANPDEPYVYPVKAPASQLRSILSEHGYHERVIELGVFVEHDGEYIREFWHLFGGEQP